MAKKDDFDYSELAKVKWRELVGDAQDKYRISFDLENDDGVKFRDIEIPQTFWDFTKCKFRCELRQAGGDWQSPIFYFRCQLKDGYAFDVGKYGNSMFVFIPGKEGNIHLAKTSKGEWTAPNHEEDEREPDEKKCWHLLEKYLRDIVYKEIDKIKKQRTGRKSQ